MHRKGAWTKRLDALLARCVDAFDGFDEQGINRLRHLLIQLRKSTMPLSTSLENAHRLPGKMAAVDRY